MLLEIIREAAGMAWAWIMRKAEGRANHEDWRAQQRWQYYKIILEQLGKWETSLVDCNSYYIEPGSDYDETIPNGERFQKLWRDGDDSRKAIRALIGPASILLPTKTIEALKTLISDDWSVAEDSLCMADYVSKALQLVKVAEIEILADAENELSRLHAGPHLLHNRRLTARDADRALNLNRS